MWQIRYFPPSDDRDSPYDYVLALPDPAERAEIVHRLSYLQRSEPADWPHTWIKKVAPDILQLKAGRLRLLFCVDGTSVVILHVCRKVKAKLHARDKARAEAHLGRYRALRSRDWK